MRTLAERLGVEGTGLAIYTCPRCGSHTACKATELRCWACEPKATDLPASVVVVPQELTK